MLKQANRRKRQELRTFSFTIIASIILLCFFGGIASAQTVNQTVNLKSGFNFIAFTVSPSLSPEELRQSNVTLIDDIYFYSASAGSFLSLSEKTLTSLAAGKGYIVKAKTVGSMIVSGTAPTAVPDAQLKAGFNLIGISQSVSTNTFSGLMKSFGIIKGLYKWNASAGSFIQVVMDSAGTPQLLDVFDPQFQVGESYFINVYDNTTLSFGGSSLSFVGGTVPVTPSSDVPATALTDIPPSERTSGAGNIAGKITAPASVSVHYSASESLRAIAVTNTSDIKVWIKNHPEINAKTDAEGNFVLKNVPKAVKETGHTLEYEKIEGENKFNGVIENIPVVESKQIDVSKYIGPLVIKKSAVVQGKISLADGLSPLGAEAYIAGISAMIAKADDDGSFSLMDVPAGTFNIVFQAYGYEISRQTVTLEANEIKQLTAVQLKKITPVSTVGSVDGYVLASDGLPVAGAVVSIISADRSVDIGAISSATGRFNFSNLTAGKYKLVFLKDGYNGSEKEIDIAVGVTAKHNQTMTKIVATQSSAAAFGLIAGRVKDLATGAPIRNAVVLTVPPTRQFYTDYNGYFDFLIQPGTYTLKIQKIGYNEEQLSLTVEADKVKEIEAALESKAGTAIAASVSLNVTSLSIGAGDTNQLTATIKDSAGNILSGKPIVWASTDTAVAEVTQGGLITAKKEGSCSITASIDGKVATLSMTVKGASGPVVTAIKVYPETVTLKLTESKQFVIFATYDDGSSKIIPNTMAAWTSSSDSLTMLDKGSYIAFSPGGAVVTAKFNALSSTASVTVIDSSDAEPPLISHSIPIYTADKDLIISANVTDNAGVSKVWLFFRTIGAASFIKVEMTASATGRYSYTIPAALATNEGINYYITAEDTKSPTPNKSTYPVNGPTTPLELKPLIALSSLTLSKSADKVNLSSSYDLTPIVSVAKYSDGTGKIVVASWSVVSGGGTLNGKIYTAPSSGTQATLKATYTENGISAGANFVLTLEQVGPTVTSIVNPSDIYVATDTLQWAIPFPTVVTVALSNATTGTKTVTWSTASTPAYNASLPGTYSFTGAVEGTTLTARINVIIFSSPSSVVITGTLPALAAPKDGPGYMINYGANYEMGVLNFATMTEITGSSVVINGPSYTATVPAGAASVTALVVIKHRATGKITSSALAVTLPTAAAMNAASVSKITISGVNLTAESMALAAIAKDKAIVAPSVPVSSSVTTMSASVKSTVESAVGTSTVTSISNAVSSFQTVLNSSYVSELTKTSILSVLDVTLSGVLNAFVVAVKDASAVVTSAGGATTVTAGGQTINAFSTPTDVYNAVNGVVVVSITGVTNPADITVASGTAVTSITFPSTVSVTMSNGTTATKSVVWSTASIPAYNAATNGTYVFTGIVSGTTLTASVKVIVGSAQQIVATPTFSPAGGTYNSAQSVTIACTTTGASIYYTVDGTNPTLSSALYIGPISVSTTATIKAIAAKTGMTNSGVAASSYVINIPNIPIITNERAVQQANGDLLVTWNTNFAPTMAAKVIARFSNQVSNAYVIESSYNSTSHSVVLPASILPLNYDRVVISYVIGEDGTYKEILKSAITFAKLSTPVISLASGTYFGAQTISISGPVNATIKYTLDGSTPSRTNGIVYPPQGIMIRSGVTVKAMAYLDGIVDSDIISATYVIQLTINNEKAVKMPNGDMVVTWNTGIVVSTAAKIIFRLNNTPSPHDPFITENPVSNALTHSATIPAGNVPADYAQIVISHLVGDEGNMKEILKSAVINPARMNSALYDESTNILTIGFNQHIKISSLQLSNIQLKSNEMGIMTLGAADTIMTTADSDSVNILLSSANEVRIKQYAYHSEAQVNAFESAFMTVNGINNTRQDGTSPYPNIAFSVIKDVTKPTLMKVISQDNKYILATFSETVGGSALNIANYKLYSYATGSLSDLVPNNTSPASNQISASVSFTDATQKTVKISILEAGSNLASYYPNNGLNNSDYRLYVSNVTDIASTPNTIIANSNYSFAGTAPSTGGPVVVSASASDQMTIKINFDRALDAPTAQLIANYKIYPSGNPMSPLTINSAALTDSATNKKTVQLITAAQSGGVNYTLEVSGVKDIFGYMMSAQSQTIVGAPATTPPTISAAKFIDVNANNRIDVGDKFQITFNKPVKLNTSSTAANANAVFSFIVYEMPAAYNKTNISADPGNEYVINFNIDISWTSNYFVSDATINLMNLQNLIVDKYSSVNAMRQDGTGIRITYSY
ncbi:MAG: Peptidylarginine deiminase precursor [bacterium ADurb.Bin243]|nr:MAG: Peptidylarginine deiminase precursor [bacterium ADurb.Bin243]